MTEQSVLAGLDVYVVGGAVRDQLLNMPVGDQDWVVVGASPEEMVKRGQELNEAYSAIGQSFMDLFASYTQGFVDSLGITNEGMKSFVKNYIRQYDNCKEVPVHFVGSIAFYLKDELQLTFDKYEMTLGNVLRRPIDGLIAYHIMNK